MHTTFYPHESAHVYRKTGDVYKMKIRDEEISIAE